MATDIECDKLFTVKLTLKHYDENMTDSVQEKLYWDTDLANVGWCAGTHIASAISRLFPGEQQKELRRDCFRSIIDTFDADTKSGDYDGLE